jgi:hypothetical protein
MKPSLLELAAVSVAVNGSVLSAEDSLRLFPERLTRAFLILIHRYFDVAGPPPGS